MSTQKQRITNKQLEQMSKQEIDTMDKSQLQEITTIHMRRDLHHHEKMLIFFHKIKNPYCFLCRDCPVRVCFSDHGPKLEKVLQAYFIGIKQG